MTEVDDAAPVAVLIQDESSGRWRIDLHTLTAFRAALGDDVVREFACCFVHADRLTSLTSLFHLSKTHYGEASVAFRRNFETVTWMSVGTLRELALALRALRSALAKRGTLDPNSPSWLRLREVEDRWVNDAFFRDMRNKVAFHVDAEAVEAGLKRPAAAGNVTLVEGDSPKQIDSSLRLGIESLVMGTGLTLDEFDRFFGAASQDHGVGAAIQSAFVEVAEKAGLKLVSSGQRR